jgi:Calcineurin-like phosphoesterase
MVRRLTVTWPEERPFLGREGAPIHWLAVSDEPDPALEHERNRHELPQLDAVIGCGDLEPEYLGFLADAFRAPAAYVRGNHDRGGRWAESVASHAPAHLDSGRVHRLDGLAVGALEWPGLRHGDRKRHDGSAWWDSLGIARSRLLARATGGDGPLVVISHAPPRGIGDRAADPYHVGFGGYRWLLERTRPVLWLHGHVPPASVEGWKVEHDGTPVVNVTGSVLVEIVPPQNGGQGTAGQVGEG